MLTSAELASMRATMESAFDQSCTRTRIPAGPIVNGDRTDGTPETADYACRVRHDGRGQESRIGGSVMSVGDWRILLPEDADVLATDQISIGDDVWEVQEVDPPKSDRLCIVAVCVKLTSAPARS